MINPSALRERMLAYMEINQPVLISLLKNWNQKLDHGVGMEPALYFDLFGYDILATIAEELFAYMQINKNVDVSISAAPIVNANNAFQSQLLYKFQLISRDENSNTEYFTLGEEEVLVDYLEKIIAHYEKGDIE